MVNGRRGSGLLFRPGCQLIAAWFAKMETAAAGKGENVTGQDASGLQDSLKRGFQIRHVDDR